MNDDNGIYQLYPDVEPLSGGDIRLDLQIRPGWNRTLGTAFFLPELQPGGILQAVSAVSPEKLSAQRKLGSESGLPQ